MLKLRRARVLEVGSPAAAEQPLRIVLVDEGGGVQSGPRDAIAQVALVGCAQVDDEVIVNTQARDLGLGSGGFDIVHVNITRGLRGEGRAGAHVMKLNYTSLQHAVEPVEGSEPDVDVGGAVAVIALHGQLAAVAWAFARARPRGRLGYVQTGGGALPGSHSRVTRHLRSAGLLAGHVTAGAAFGGEGEAISTIGALAHGFGELGWGAAVCGPGPGLIGSGSVLGHGGMAALDSAHCALALGLQTVVVVRMSSSDPRSRHRGISHHSLTVLDLLLAPVVVAIAPGMRPPAEDLEVAAEQPPEQPELVHSAAQPSNGAARKGDGVATRRLRLSRHDWRARAIDLPGYVASGLPAETMGRSLWADPFFFAAALAGGGALADLVPAEGDDEGAGQTHGAAAVSA